MTIVQSPFTRRALAGTLPAKETDAPLVRMNAADARLRAEVEAVGGTVRFAPFDAGYTVTVALPGRPSRRFTSYHGDEPDATVTALAFVRAERDIVGERDAVPYSPDYGPDDL